MCDLLYRGNEYDIINIVLSTLLTLHTPTTEAAARCKTGRRRHETFSHILGT